MVDHSLSETAGDRQRGCLIALIGPDGAGKTTQAKSLQSWLRRNGYPVSFQPSESVQPLKRMFAGIAAHPAGLYESSCLSNEAKQLGYAMVKWTGLHKLSALQDGDDVVITDRYSYCHIAAARAQNLRCANLIATMFQRFRAPDVTLYLRLTPHTALARVRKRGSDVEPTTLAQLAAYIDEYERLRARHSFVTIDAEPCEQEVYASIQQAVALRLSGHPASKQRNGMRGSETPGVVGI